MWISRQFIKPQDNNGMQTGKVTLNKNGNIEASATGIERNIQLSAPYGYTYSLPTGTDMLLTHCDGEQLAIGVSMIPKGLSNGEIKITAASGAYIYLKNNGSVIINGLEISRSGEIIDD